METLPNQTSEGNFTQIYDQAEKKYVEGFSCDQEKRTIAVIDDDRDFGKLVKYLGEEMGMEVHYFESLMDMGSVSKLGDYNAVIIDYYLEQMNGIEIAEYIDAFFPWIPAVLTSGDTYFSDVQNLPKCVSGFIAKACGAQNIVKAAAWAIEHRNKVK